MGVLHLLSLFLLASTVSAAPVRRPTKRPTKRPTAKPVAPAYSPVAKKIAFYCPGSFGAFVAGSYQLKALRWVESLSGANSFVASKAVQYYTLACLYYATNAVANPVTKALRVTPKPWLRATNWLSKTIAPCSWLGVTCVNGKVTKLSLSSNQLSGFTPIELILLSSSNPSLAGSINYIDFYNNTYLFTSADTGGANWIGSLGPNMQKLFLGTTAFFSKKGVPDIFGKLVNLLELDVSYTYITGALRATPFTTLKKLEYLEISGNAYNSTVPAVLGTLPALKYLYIVDANIAGGLSFMITMPKIEELWVDQNSLKGTIPTQIGNLLNLASFSVSRNQLSGSIPTQMSKLVKMQQMWFHVNKLGGSFPNGFTTMKSLTTFHAESNNIKGTVSTLCSALAGTGRKLTSLGVDCASPVEVVCPSTCKVCCCSVSACGDTL